MNINFEKVKKISTITIVAVSSMYFIYLIFAMSYSVSGLLNESRVPVSNEVFLFDVSSVHIDTGLSITFLY